MGLGDVWGWTRLAVDIATTPIQNMQDRKAYREHEEWEAARAAEEAPLVSSQEVRDIIFAVSHRARIWNYLETDFGKCAACKADLGRTDLDPNRPYFCSDKCKEDCAYIDVDKITNKYADTLNYVLASEYREAQREAQSQLEKGDSEAKAERKRRETELSRRYAYKIDLDADDVPRGARKDKEWFQEAAARYKREERAILLKVRHDHERRVVALEEETARQIKEKMEYNRTHFDEMYLEYKRRDKERHDEAEQRRIEAERPWYTSLGKPPDHS
jgi:endogenous inhibitor of DNA gyrase (YacG/DUF329 family)